MKPDWKGLKGYTVCVDVTAAIILIFILNLTLNLQLIEEKSKARLFFFFNWTIVFFCNRMQVTGCGGNVLLSRPCTHQRCRSEGETFLLLIKDYKRP